MGLLWPRLRFSIRRRAFRNCISLPFPFLRVAGRSKEQAIISLRSLWANFGSKARGFHARFKAKFSGWNECDAGRLRGETRVRRAQANGVLQETRLAPVRVSADRVIRTITGLRPFRPSGFVVRGEKRGDKTVVHNYGHGGDGSTCSGERSESEARGCAVLGCGVVGLSTARLL